MDEQKLAELIQYIVWRVEEIGGYTVTIRLVKFLYLIDLEYQRRLGRTLTGLDWVYYHYGPYAFELPEISDKLGFDLQRETFVADEGHEGTRLWAREPRDGLAELDYVAKVVVEGILDVWADVETSLLLEYVYHTEPMLHAERGEPLDLSVVPRGTRYYELNVSVEPDTASRLRESVRDYREKDAAALVRPETVCDEILEQGLRALEEDEEPVPGLTGLNPEVCLEQLSATVPNGD